VRTSWNVALQVAALLAFAALRLTAWGWLLMLAVLTGIALVLLVPTAIAVTVLPRRRLSTRATAAFVAAAATQVGVGLVLPDADFFDRRAPLFLLLGEPDSVPDWAWTAGWTLVVAHLACLVWVAAALRRPGTPDVPCGPLPHTEPPGGPGEGKP
jgi:MFS family permease